MIRFGIAVGAYSSGVPGAPELVELARTAEAVGFDSVQVGDHVQWHAPILEATTVLATFAAATSRIRIASNVIILPLRDPVLIAKTIASLDVLSGGRMIFGVGVGGDHPAEYRAMRVPLGERGSRANESLEIVRGLFANERFSYVGRHFTFEDALPRRRRCSGRPATVTAGSAHSPASGNSRASSRPRAACSPPKAAPPTALPGVRSCLSTSGPTPLARGQLAPSTSVTCTACPGKRSWIASVLQARSRSARSASAPLSKLGWSTSSSGRCAAIASGRVSSKPTVS